MLVVDLRIGAAGSRPVSKVAWQQPAGTITVLFGPSGAGKTTVLRAVAGLLDATGLLTWHGRPLMGQPVYRRPVGYVAQDASVFPHWPVAYQIAQARPGHQLDDRAQAMVSTLGLEPLMARRSRTLSGGQAQRVVMARTLARDPEILLLDEPFSSLDAVTRRDLGRFVRQWAEAHRAAVVMASHDWQEVERLADQVLLMDAGQILGWGPPAMLFRSPPSARAAMLVGYDIIWRGFALHPLQAEWAAVDACPIAVEGTVRHVTDTGLGWVATIELDADRMVDAVGSRETPPKPGQHVRVGFWAPKVAS